VDGDPPSKLAIGDEITFVGPMNDRRSGKITAVSGTTCTVQIENKYIQIRRKKKAIR
jgi:hypothetical protein